MTSTPLARQAALAANAKGQLRPVNSQPLGATPVTVAALILREMTATYGRRPGGYVWAVLEPAAGVIILTYMFSLIARTPPLGINFAIFYATGLAPFFLFNDLSKKVGQSLNYSRNLLGYPRVTIMDAILARLILNTLTQILVTYLILSVILMTNDTQTILNLPRAALAMSMAVVLGGGIGILNCFLIARFPLWQTIWGLITRPLILISGVIFLFDDLPEPLRSYLWYNPLVHPIGEMRRAFYGGYVGEYVTPSYTFAVGLICGVVGLVFLRRYHRDILER